MSVEDEVKEQIAQLDKLITYYEYCVEEAESKKERERLLVTVSNLRAQKERKDAIESLTRTELSKSSHEQRVDRATLEVVAEQKIAYREIAMMPAATSA